MSHSRACILGISFDGLGISGIVNELLNAAAALRSAHLRILIDLGYDITLGRTKNLHNAFMPSWASNISCIGDVYPHSYDQNLINSAFSTVVNGTRVTTSKVYLDVIEQLAGLMFTTCMRENVRFMIVENGTLPDNPLFTEALYLAIDEYGAKQKLGKYVMWRDHDLMWSAEPHLYGSYPYSGVRKPEKSQYIEYFVATEWMRKRMRAWAPSATYNVLPNRFFAPELTAENTRSVRSSYGIPNDAYLIARCTRVIPQKTIERDLRLVHDLQLRLDRTPGHRKLFLVVTGPTGEDPQEFDRLRRLEQTLSIVGQVIWADGILPFNSVWLEPLTDTTRFSIGELLNESHISSFLTSYAYEGFGNPPGEAMAMGVPFISTTYELYHEVYGARGAVAPLLPIDRQTSTSDPIPDWFVDWSLQLLSEAKYRDQVSSRNLEVCQRYFSIDALQRQLREIFVDLE
jgi:glycosyltransferase involved in cell wall biosynthesis